MSSFIILIIFVSAASHYGNTGYKLCPPDTSKKSFSECMLQFGILKQIKHLEVVFCCAAADELNYASAKSLLGSEKDHELRKQTPSFSVCDSKLIHHKTTSIQFQAFKKKTHPKCVRIKVCFDRMGCIMLMQT